MKKLVSSIVCLVICFSIQAQTQTGKVTITPVGNGERQVERSAEPRIAPAPVTPAHQCEQHKAVEQKNDAVATPHACPKAATCPKATGNQGETKPCCAKHQGTQPDAAKTEQKAGCNHQHAEQKAGCNHNHGSSEKNASPKKKGTKKK